MAGGILYLDKEDRELLLETRRRLEEATKLLDELIETLEILRDPDMMAAIRKGREDVKAGRVTELHELLRETSKPE